MFPSQTNHLLERQVGVSAEPVTTSRPELLKVAATSRPNALAGAIAGIAREGRQAEVQAIGAGAVNQAIKAIAIARSYLRDEGLELVCIPGFANVVIQGEERTAVCLLVEPRHPVR